MPFKVERLDLQTPLYNTIIWVCKRVNHNEPLKTKKQLYLFFKKFFLKKKKKKRQSSQIDK